MKINAKLKVVIAIIVAMIAIIAFNTKAKAAEYEYKEEAYEQEGASMVAEQNEYICNSDYYVDGNKGVNTLFCMNINRISKVNYRISTNSKSSYINGHIIYTKGDEYNNNNLDGLAGYAAYQEYQLEQAILKGRKYDECSDEEKAIIDGYKRTLQKIFWSTKVEAKTVLKSKEDPLSESEGVLSFTDESSAIGTDNYAAEDFEDLITTDKEDKKEEVKRNQRAYQYNLVYDTIIKYIKQTDEEIKNQVYTNLLKNDKELSSKDVQVLVNQTAGTYTVGPYKLNLVVNSDVIDNKIVKYDENGNKESIEEDSVTKEEIIKYINSNSSIDNEFRNIIGLSPLDLLKKELVGQNEGWTDENKFAWFDEQNPVEFKIDGAKNIRVLDVNGNEIKDLTKILDNNGGSGKEFFIEFEPEDYTKFINEFKIDLNFNVKIVNRHGMKRTVWKSEKKNEVHNSGTTEVEYKVGEALEAWGNWIKETKYTEKQSGEGTYETTASDGKTYIVYYRWQDDFVEAYKVTVKCKSYITSGGGSYVNGKVEEAGSVTIIGETEFEAEVWVEGNVSLKWEEHTTPKAQGTKPETYKDVFEYARYEKEEGDFHIKATVEFTVKIKIKWKYDWSRKFQDAVEMSTPRRMIATAENTIKLPVKGISMNIGGKIWIDEDIQKKAGYGNFIGLDGKYEYGETLYEGMEVRLYMSKYNKSKGWTAFDFVESTISGTAGKYSFEQIDPLGRYYVEFYFNGELYQQTYYKNSIPRGGGYSNAIEDASQRNAINDKFATIDGDVDGKENYDTSSNYYTDNRSYEENRAYGLNHKIMNRYGEYIATDVVNDNYYVYGLNGKADGSDGVLTYGDVFEKFREIAYAKTKNANDGTVKFDENMNRIGAVNYGRHFIIYAISNVESERSVYDELRAWLASLDIAQAEIDNICLFIYDSMITATTNESRNASNPVVYPTNTVFICEDYDDRKPEDQTRLVEFSKNVYGEVNYLYSDANCQKYDVSKTDEHQKGGVDYGIVNRAITDIELDKDVQKITMTVNGQKLEYKQGKKDFMTNTRNFNVENKNGDDLYTGKTVYNRNVRTADYLFNAEKDQGESADKDLNVYITYTIMVRNSSDLVKTKINEVIDYYDNDYLEYVDDTIISDNTYAVKVSDPLNPSSDDLSKSALTVSDTSKCGNHSNILSGDGYNYKNVKYLSSGDEVSVLNPGESLLYYITFKVKEENGKPIMDMSTAERLINKTGKRNIAEINSYTTTYIDGAKVPYKLDKDDNRIEKDVSGNAGIIDRDSNPGSLRNIDIYQKSDLSPEMQNDYTGRLITSENVIDNRKEDDIAEAPNVRLIFPKDENRTIKGSVFEDIRKINVDKAAIGDGKLSDEEFIDGITVQLVEIVTDINDKGEATGIKGERVVTYKKYSLDGKEESEDNLRAATGKEEKVIKSFNAETSKLAVIGNDHLNKGEYSFTNIPAGYYYVRFVYGDNDENVLTNKDAVDESKYDYSANVNSLIGKSGKNAKSYNGQDYKSTIYESANEAVVIGNTTIAPYVNDNNTDGTKQNYEATASASKNVAIYNENGEATDVEYKEKINNGTDAATMYAFDINKNAKNIVNEVRTSDAKDVYAYRQRGIDWANGVDTTNDLRNYRAEVLSSFNRVLTYNNEATNKSLQEAAINELKYHTQMVAQTGVIDMTIEINTDSTNKNKAENKANHDEIQVVTLDNLETVYDYTIENVDFGLVERPRAQLALNKEVANFKFRLSTGQDLVDSDKTRSEILSFIQHKQHEVGRNAKNIISSYRIAANDPTALETVSMQLDDELIAGSQIIVTYNIRVTNVGDVDYTSKKFYYLGQKADDDQVSKTQAVTVIDYPTNGFAYSEADQTQEGNKSIWNNINTVAVEKKSEVSRTGSSVDDNMEDTLIVMVIPDEDNSNDVSENAENSTNASYNTDSINNHNDPTWANDYTNRQYVTEAATYNTVLLTNKLDKELLPDIENKDASSVNKNLVLKANMDVMGGTLEDLTYNNLSEIVATRNDQGRRMQFSIVGNEKLARNDAGADAANTVNTQVDRIKVSEIDADSAQKIQIGNPTGNDKNYIVIAATIIAAIALIGGAIFVIKKRIVKK